MLSFFTCIANCIRGFFSCGPQDPERGAQSAITHTRAAPPAMTHARAALPGPMATVNIRESLLSID